MQLYTPFMKCFLMLRQQLGLVLLEASHSPEKYSVVIIIETYRVSSPVSSVVCFSGQIIRKMQKPTGNNVSELITVLLNVG